MKNAGRIYLSPPCTGDEERAVIAKAFDSGYIAPCGPFVDEFEKRLAKLANRKFAVAVSSATAALDLAMAEYGVDETWVVIAPTLTFIATVGPAFHRGARIVFVDSDETGNIDITLLEEALKEYRSFSPHLMIIGVDLYGRCSRNGEIARLALRYGAKFILDSAEAVGAISEDGPAGSQGEMAVFSFNGNKIITTSGGGALLCDDEDKAARARKRSQQSRENVPWYEHKEVGYNYRMSNILAALGLAQLEKLPRFIERKKEICRRYKEGLSPFGWEFLPSVEGENYWLTIALAPSQDARDNALRKLEQANIEARCVWKPMHLQSVFAQARVFGGKVSENLFNRGICLPSGSGLSNDDIERILLLLCH